MPAIFHQANEIRVRLNPSQQASLRQAIAQIREGQEVFEELRFDLAVYLLDLAMLDISAETGAVQCDAAPARDIDPTIKVLAEMIKKSGSG